MGIGIYKQRPELKRTEASPAVPSGPSIAELARGAAPTEAQMGHRVDLPEVIREKMESSFGADFSGVRLFESDTVAEAGAEAVARGNSIAFAPGKLDFASTAGQALLGHELSHVVSQARGESVGNGFLNNAALEAQADRQGMLAARGESAYAGPVTPLSVSSASAASGPMQAKKYEDKAAAMLNWRGKDVDASKLSFDERRVLAHRYDELNRPAVNFELSLEGRQMPSIFHPIQRGRVGREYRKRYNDRVSLGRRAKEANENANRDIRAAHGVYEDTKNALGDEYEPRAMPFERYVQTGLAFGDRAGSADASQEEQDALRQRRQQMARTFSASGKVEDMIPYIVSDVRRVNSMSDSLDDYTVDSEEELMDRMNKGSANFLSGHVANIEQVIGGIRSEIGQEALERMLLNGEDEDDPNKLSREEYERYRSIDFDRDVGMAVSTMRNLQNYGNSSDRTIIQQGRTGYESLREYRRARREGMDADEALILSSTYKANKLV